MQEPNVTKPGKPGLAKRVGLGLAALALISAAAGTYLAAQPQGDPQGRRPFMSRGGAMGRGGPGGGPLAGLPLRRLNLTEAQRGQVQTVLESHRQDMAALSERMRTARQALAAAVTADTFDEATVRARSADVAAVEADMAVHRARVFQEVFRLLTPEQQETARKLQADMQQRAQERPQGRRGARRR